MFETWETAILNLIYPLYDTIGWWGVSALLILENATGITPSEVILGLAGWLLISAKALPYPMVFLGALFGAVASLAGSSLTYWATRLGGRPLVHKIIQLFGFETELLEKAEQLLHKKGSIFIFLARLIPGIRTIINVPAGLLRLPFPRFMVLTFAGTYIWSALLLSIGFILGEEWHLIQTFVSQYKFLAMIFIAAGAFLLFWLYRKRSNIINQIIRRID